MSDIHFRLGPSIELKPMLPAQAGVPTELPAGIPHSAGLYLILNQLPHPSVENRYMGVSQDLRRRFASRQASCFELGFNPSVLDNVFAFMGEVEYLDSATGQAVRVTQYDHNGLAVKLDGHSYDLEHVFIKAAQHAWPYGTITNTNKTGPLVNAGVQPLRIRISWERGYFPEGHVDQELPAGHSWF